MSKIHLAIVLALTSGLLTGAENCLDHCEFSTASRAWSSPGEAKVLIYDDNTKNQFALKALEAMDVPFTRGFSGDFARLLTRQEWSIVILDFPSTIPVGEWEAALINYLRTGGRVVISFWDLDRFPALQEALDVTAVGDLSGLSAIYPWTLDDPFWQSPNRFKAALSPGRGSWGDKGDRLRSNHPLGGFTTSARADQGAVALGNDGRSLTIGYLVDLLVDDANGNGRADGIDLYQNAYARVSGSNPIPGIGRDLSGNVWAIGHLHQLHDRRKSHQEP